MPVKAAVLRTLGKPPRFEEFPDPKPSQGEVIVRVKAASLAASGKLSINTEQAPLADVETAWQRQDLPGRRLVVIP